MRQIFPVSLRLLFAGYIITRVFSSDDLKLFADRFLRACGYSISNVSSPVSNPVRTNNIAHNSNGQAVLLKEINYNDGTTYGSAHTFLKTRQLG